MHMLDGSQPDRQQPAMVPSEFLAGYVQKLNSYRRPDPFEIADKGAVSQDVATNLAGRM